MALLSEVFLLPTTCRVDRDRLRQNCTLEFSYEAEPLAKGTGERCLKSPPWAAPAHSLLFLP